MYCVKGASKSLNLPMVFGNEVLKGIVDAEAYLIAKEIVQAPTVRTILI